ncbi:hypothetical protein [Allomuricauda sp. ARW1Y1]|jgi:hypothetical protein|uniref:hypothetical protein n=1 Tax=Allomuricauda sp. ARW1Y1 TaxID=2663843 RepID=UPI0015CBB220|nr:hypothetical protein [Muricauda sp. ARW1Y1]NYJ27531.1 hypothetical protein [Muricauda sp. ARW1Y1]
MSVLRITYPTKTNNPSDPDSVRKFQFNDANDLKAAVNNHADNLDQLLQAVGITEGTNSIGVFVSLSILQAAYPNGANGSYAVIDDGQGGTPNVATYNNGTSLWELSTPDESIIWVSNQAALPGTGISQKLYIALDTGTFYYWTGSQYETAGPSVEVVVKYIQNNGRYFKTEKGYGNSGSGHEENDIVEGWHDNVNRDRWSRGVIIGTPVTLPADFDDQAKIFLLNDKININQ